MGEQQTGRERDPVGIDIDALLLDEDLFVPIEPAAPVGPAGPVGPIEPAAPVGPAGPAGPAGPVGPVDDDRSPAAVRGRLLRLGIGLAVGLVVVAVVVAVGLRRHDDNQERLFGGPPTTIAAPVAGSIPDPGTEQLPAPGPAPARSGGWSMPVEGRPVGIGDGGVIDEGLEAGVYVWSDFGGWHLLVVPGADGPESVEGVITSNEALQPGRIVVDGAGAVETDGAEITVRLTFDAAANGVDFDLGFFGSEVRIELAGPDGQPLELPVFAGGTGQASALPIEVRRS